MSAGKVRVLWTAFHRFWPTVAVDSLRRRYSAEFEFTVLEWPCSTADRLRFFLVALQSDIVVRVGMKSELESRANRLWDWFARTIYKRPVIAYWTGTDVTALLARAANGGIDPRLRSQLDRTYHLSSSACLEEELLQVGVHSRTVEFLTPERDIPDPPPPLPPEFSVLSYWGEGTGQELFELYGGPTVFESARAMPDVRFDIVGSTGSRMSDVPPNVAFHGLVPDVGPFLERSVAVVRNVEHDAAPGGMVEEALLFGRYVVYSYEWPHTQYARYGDAVAVTSSLLRLKEQFERGRLQLNCAGRESTIKGWNPDRRAAELRQAILDALHCEPSEF